MKKLIIILLLAFATNTLSAQHEDKQYMYCEIVGQGNFLGTKVKISIDYGQKSKWAEDKRIRNEKGELMNFNSMVDAMNWLSSYGWEFKQAYVVTSGNTNVYHWLLQLDITDMSTEEVELRTGQFKIKSDFKHKEDM